MAAWAREEKNVSENRQRKREVEEADKVEVISGVTVESLGCFRVTLIGPTQGHPKPTPIGCLRTLRIGCCRCHAFLSNAR